MDNYYIPKNLKLNYNPYARSKLYLVIMLLLNINATNTH